MIKFRLFGKEMGNQSSFLQMVEFFQRSPASTPGDREYNAAFCHSLVTATSADAASIWQTDTENQLHLIFSTDIHPDQVTDITLREGEGISGAAALSRQPVFVVNAQNQNLHDLRIDERYGMKTYAMISAPILFEDHLFGVLNILSHHADKFFPSEWKEWLSALAVMYAAALVKAGKLTSYRARSKIRMRGSEQFTKVSEGKTAIVGISQAVQDALYLCLKAGQTDIPVLICGETGTGKELAARRIHEASSRVGGPFLEVNCAALTETLLESELFGHVKGAFTGATHDRQGKFVASSGGTLFLDEIGEMDLASQAKILRALEERKITPLGSEKTIQADTRIIAATNKDLIEMMKEKMFREDLYYRLCGLEISIPSLRNRVEDIPLLALHFLNKIHSQLKRKQHEQPLRLSSEALDLLTTFHWPGNVRQLEQALLAAAALCEGDEISSDNFPAWFHKAIESQSKKSLRPSPSSPSSEMEPLSQEENQLSKEERIRYLEVLNATKYPGTGRWNVSAAARVLGIPRETLAYRLRKQSLSGK
jgi:transcriptional regulator with GAF, ATPase, and Fis domain